MPVGIDVLATSGADITTTTPVFPAPSMAIVLNDDFYDDGTGVATQGGTGGPLYASVSLLVMDSIFDSGWNTFANPAGVVIVGENNGGDVNNGFNHAQIILPSQLVYNDFFGLTTNYSDGGLVDALALNVASGSQFVNPEFRNPLHPANFFLELDLRCYRCGPQRAWGDALRRHALPAGELPEQPERHCQPQWHSDPQRARLQQQRRARPDPTGGRRQLLGRPWLHLRHGSNQRCSVRGGLLEPAGTDL